MTDYYVTYWGTDEYSSAPFFEVIPVSAIRVKRFKEQVIPGTEGLKPTYVRWHCKQVGQDRLHLVTYTHEELKAYQVKQLLSQAVRFVEKQNL